MSCTTSAMDRALPSMPNAVAALPRFFTLPVLPGELDDSAVR